MGGVRGDSPYEKQPAIQRHHLSVSQPCSAVGPLFGGSVSVRTRFSSSVLGVSSVLFSAFVHRAFVFDGSLLFSTWRVFLFLFFVGCFFSGSFLGLLLSGSVVVGTFQGCFSLLLTWTFPGAFCSTRSSS